MNRPVIGGLLLLVVASICVVLLLLSEDPAEVLEDAVPEPAAVVDHLQEPAVPAPSLRELAEAAADASLDEPPAAWVDAMGGIIGRIVDSVHTPLPELRVELMGGNLFDLLPAEDAWFADVPPDVGFVVAETRTDEAGRFRFDGVDPHGFFLLAIDINGPRATYRVVDVTPNSGQVADLGDIVLDPYVTLVGRVIDEDDDPVDGARVRVTELPGEPFQFGLGRVRAGAAVAGGLPEMESWMVLPLPPLAFALVGRIPYHETTTAADGSFRLEGVPIGTVTILVDHAGMVPLVRGPVPTGAEGERRVPDLRLFFGDELIGRVVRNEDEPVVGATVLVGEQLPIVPAALLLPAGVTDETGTFRAEGLADRPHVVAVRAKDATSFELVKGVMPGIDEPVIRLEDSWSLKVTARDEAGEIIRHPKLMIQQADLLIDVLLVVPPTPLAGRTKPQDDGSVLVTGLSEGDYHVFVRAPGFAVNKKDVRVDGPDIALDVVLEPELTGTVQVIGGGEPVEYALVSVFSTDADDDEPFDFVPRVTRRTDRNGMAFLNRLEPGDLRVRVFHPAYAVGSGVLRAPGPPIIVELSGGGSLSGTIFRDGVPAATPHWVITLPEVDGETPLPRITRTDPDGAYRITHLRAGPYQVYATERLTGGGGGGGPSIVLNASASSSGDESDGGGVGTDFTAGPNSETGRQAEIIEGEETVLDIDLMRLEGAFPKARLLGRVTLNGVAAEGLEVSVEAKSEGRTSRSARTDAQGMFDVGEVPAGDLVVQVMRQDGGSSGALALRDVRLEPNDVTDLLFTIECGRLNGRVLAVRDGAPIPYASLRLLATDAEDGVELTTASDEDGRYSFEFVPVGTYLVMAEHAGFARATSSAVSVPARGAPASVDLRLRSAVTVSGTVRVPPEAGPAPYLFLYLDGEQEAGLGSFTFVDPETRSFELTDVSPGTYRVQVFGAESSLEQKTLEVPVTGLIGVVLFPDVVVEEEE